MDEISLKDIILERGILTEDELKKALDPDRITVPGILKKEE